MTASERKFLEMAVALARTVRRGGDLELARAAAEREQQWQRELDTTPAPPRPASPLSDEFGGHPEPRAARR